MILFQSAWSKRAQLVVQALGWYRQLKTGTSFESRVVAPLLDVFDDATELLTFTRLPP